MKLHTSARRSSTIAWLSAALSLMLLMGGCLGKPSSKDGTGASAGDDDIGVTEDDAFAALEVAMAAFGGVPGSADEHILELSIDSVSLLDEATDTWLPLLAAPAAVELLVDGTLGPAEPLVTVPVPAGSTYAAVEIIAATATLVASSGTTETTVAAVACYTSLTIMPAADDTLGVTLVLSAEDALTQAGSGWTFQPALTGTLITGDDSPSQDAEESDNWEDPYCTPY